MTKRLSIVIPTYNRYEYLRRTIELLLPQIERNTNEVQFIVGANACSDQTDKYMSDLVAEYSFIEYHYFEKYAEVGESIIRTVNLAQGERILIWGDDDIPYPFLIDFIIDIINKYKDIGIIYLNRLSGKDSIYGIKNMKVYESDYDGTENILTIQQLVEMFTIGLGFISSIIFTKSGWEDGTISYSKKYYGYEFLPIIIKGESNKSCLYCSLPLEIQRNPLNRDFSAKWPLYNFVGIPNMMSDFDRWGITNNALSSWDKTSNSNVTKFIWNMMYTSLDKKLYKSRINELIKYQNSCIRKFLTYLIVWFTPTCLFKAIKNKIYK